MTSSTTIPRPSPGGPSNRQGRPDPRIPGSTVKAVPRRRLATLISLGMILILGCGALGGWLFLQNTRSVTYVGIAEPIAQGQVIQREHLTPVRARLEGAVAAIPGSRVQEVIGQRALVPLAQGSLLFEGQYGAAAEGYFVGVRLEAGKALATRLAPGDMVAVVEVPTESGTSYDDPDVPGNSLRTLTRDARVRSVIQLQANEEVVVDLQVGNLQVATDIARMQAVGQVSLILVPGAA